MSTRCAVVVREGDDDRGDRCPLRRDLRRLGVQGHDQADHRQGRRRDERVDRPAAGNGLRGDLRRRDLVKVRDGQVGNRPVYAAIGVDLDGHKDVLGMWSAPGAGRPRSSG